MLTPEISAALFLGGLAAAAFILILMILVAGRRG